MSNSDDLDQTFADICVLYELALASGATLDAQKTCDRFTEVLAARKGVSYSAIWLRSNVVEAGAPPELRLFHASPRPFIKERSIPTSHRIWRAARKGKALSISDQDPEFPSFITESGIQDGAYGIFPLLQDKAARPLGFLKIYERVPSNVLSPRGVAQLDTVARHFAASLDSCLTHDQLLREVEERRRAQSEAAAMQERLTQSEKMESIGRLAGGIAHDFNNLLTSILGASELRLLDERDPDARADLEMISRAGRRAADLVRQLLAFARPSKDQAAAIEMDGLVNEISVLLRRTVPTTIDVQVDTNQPGVLIEGSQSQLHTMVLNLAINARDAMPDGGTLTLRTSNQAPPGGMAGDRSVESWVCLSIMDTGAGIDPEIAERIFEPFFTTKPMGQGTGLGLATVYGIVESHAGIIKMDSNPGEGAVFSIYLPTSTKTLADHGDSAGQDDFRSKTQGLGLVVDDADGPRHATRRMLERIGYRVVEADSGAGAIRTALGGDEKLDFIVMDIQMPEMDGVETLRQLRDSNCQTPILMVSGYASIDHLDDLARLGVHTVLHKPYRIEDLAQAIESIRKGS